MWFTSQFIAAAMARANRMESILATGAKEKYPHSKCPVPVISP